MGEITLPDGFVTYPEARKEAFLALKKLKEEGDAIMNDEIMKDTIVIEINAMADTCPIPVVKTNKAIEGLKGPGVVETLVDNEVAVQNLTKMANHKGYGVKCEELAPHQYKVTMVISEAEPLTESGAAECDIALSAVDKARKDTVVLISSSKMGEGNDELGAVLLKGFIYALGQQETPPRTILFYNGGAILTCENSPALEDLKLLKEQGTEILTCGTCLDYYGLSAKLQVGEVTNMYVIAEKMSQADLIVKP